MPHSHRLLLAALVFVLLKSVPADAGPITERPGWSVIRTQYGYQTLIDNLDAAVKANKMGLVTRASATVGASSLGKKIPGNMVVGVYRPDFAVRMLEASVPAGIEAPIRFYITENPDGTATLSYETPSAIFEPYFEDGGDALRTLAGELDVIFAQIARDASAD